LLIRTITGTGANRLNITNDVSMNNPMRRYSAWIMFTSLLFNPLVLISQLQRVRYEHLWKQWWLWRSPAPDAAFTLL